MKSWKPSCTGSRVRLCADCAVSRGAELLHHLAFHGNPFHAHPVEIEDQARGTRANLSARIKHPRLAEPIVPRAFGNEGRIVNVTGENEVGLVALNPFHQKLVAAEL